MATEDPSRLYLTCATCGHMKIASNFPRNKRTATGYHCYCKECHNSRNRAFIKNRYGGTRHYHLRGRYGVGAEEVAQLVIAQGGLCAVCQKRPATQVDHDHKTGDVRGVVCLLCNAAMGAFGDDPQRIRRAIDYLELPR